MTVVDDSASTAADAAGKQVVVISSSSTAASVNTKFRASTVPVVTWEPALFDDLGMTAAAGAFVTGQRDLVIAAPGHPSPPACRARSRSPRPRATSQRAAPTPTPSSSPACRAALFLGDATAASFTAAGSALFDAAITWATGGS